MHSDRNAGCTTAKKLWENGVLKGDGINDINGLPITVKCNCCQNYTSWKVTHPDESRRLRELADIPIYYKAFPSKLVTIVTDQGRVQYVGTIYSVNCIGTAKTSGEHPFQCAQCHSLIHGKSSSLLRKLGRSQSLKYDRSDPERATKSGVQHKYCTTANLENSLKFKQQKIKMQQEKIFRAENKMEKLLHNSWHENLTHYPFLQTLHTLLVESKLKDFDFSFLKNWINKKAKGMNYKADEQARSLAILYSNKLGEKAYSELAPILGLPGVRQAQNIRKKEMADDYYLPGINDWCIKKASERPCKPLQNGMDGTRVVRAIELYLDKYLIGEEFSTDVRKFLTEFNLPILQDAEQVKNYIFDVRRNN